MIRRLALFLFVAFAPSAFAQSISWAGPSSATSGVPYEMNAIAPANLTIYKNGSYFASGSGYVGGVTTDTGVQSVYFTANGFSYDGIVYYSGNKSVSITTGSNPSITGVSASPTPLYPGSSFTASASFSDSDGDLNSYGLRYQGYGQIAWGGAGSPPVWNGSLSKDTSAPGTAGSIVRLRGEVFDNNGHGVTGDWVEYVVSKASQSSVSISPTSASIYVGQSVGFSASGGSGGGSYIWGGDASGSGSSNSVTFNTAGSRSVSVYRQGDANYNDSNTATASITVSKYDQTSVSSSNATITVGSSFSPNFSGGSGSGAWQWYVPGYTGWIGGSWTPPAVGSYSFYVYKDEDSTYNASNTAGAYTLQVVQANQSAVSISPSAQTITVGQSITFTASGGNGSGSYAWGGDASGTGSSKSVTFNTSGSRTVTVYRQGDGTYSDSNTASASITVKVNQAAVNISPASQTIDVGQSIAFTASGGSGSGAYVWSGDASGTGTSKNVTFNTAGSRTVAVYRQGDSTYNDSSPATAAITVRANQPAVSISPSSQTITVGQSITFNASGGAGTGSYTWGGDASGTGSSKSVTFNTTGSRSVTAYRQGDGSYTDSDTAVASVTVNAVADTQAPTAPAGLTATSISGSGFILNWNAASDNVGVTGYRVRVNQGTPGSTITTLSNTFSGLNPQTTYTVDVQARDAAGNWSNWSALNVTTSTSAGTGSGSETVWFDVNNDGLLDQVSSGNSSLLNYYVSSWYTAYTSASISINDSWGWVNTLIGDENVDNFTWRWFWASTHFWQEYETHYNLNFVIYTPFTQYPGEPVTIFRDNSASDVFNPANWQVIVDIPELLASSNIYQVGAPIDNPDDLQNARFYMVKWGKPILAAVLDLLGTSLKVNVSGTSTGPLSVPLPAGGSATVNLGTGTGSVTLPGGTVVNVGANGAVTVDGNPVGGTVDLGGGISLTVNTSGASLTIPGSGTNPALAVQINPNGSGSVTFGNGIGIAVSNTGYVTLTLPPSSPQLLVKAVDLLQRVLQLGNGATISIRDVLGVLGTVGAIVPPPASGNIADVDIRLRAGGTFEVGIKTGDNQWYWFGVDAPPRLIAVDANRDGTINFDDSDATSSGAPYRFWINDDNDELVDSSTALYTEWELDDRDVAVTNRVDWTSNTLKNTRDLEDFARLTIKAAGLTQAIGNQDVRVGFKWTDVTEGTPAIKVFRATEEDGGLKYLTDTTIADRQLGYGAVSDIRYSGNEHTLIETSGSFVLPAYVFNNLAGNPTDTAHLLFEGCKAGKGQLKLILTNRDGVEIGESPGVWLDLKAPKEFIERWSAGDGDLSAVQPVVRVNSKSVAPAWGNPVADEEKDYVLYVHGYNMQEFEKQRWIETTCKRLWHLGYKGRVGGFTWPCSQSAPPYDQSEEKAWQSATQLMALLSGLKTAGYRVHVLGHSQGNVVIGEALRQWKAAGNIGGLVRTYVASQAAIPAHCYDPNAALIPDFAGSLSDDGTPNVYANYPLTGAPYMSAAAMSGAATLFRNFQNSDDYALTGNSAGKPTWQLKQRLKPDESLGYHYNSGTFSGPIGVGTLQFPNDRFKIFAYCAEGRSFALGSTLTEGVFSGGDYNLKNQLGYGLDHIWHSGQFRCSMAERYQYWSELLRTIGITPISP